MKEKEWAEREIELACKRENPEWDGKSFDYGCSCYQSVLEAYNAAMEAISKTHHSGFSYGFTKQILFRLIDELPLTPITDEDFKDELQLVHMSPESLKEMGLKSWIDCYRMPSLTRKETLDGKVTYHDTCRCHGQDINDPNNTYLGGGVDHIVDELFPITMPYTPTRDRYVVYTESALHDKVLGGVDLKAYLYVITPEGKKVEIGKYYRTKVIGWKRYVVDGKVEERVHTKESKFFEITKEEYEALKKEQIESKPGPNDKVELVEISGGATRCLCGR